MIETLFQHLAKRSIRDLERKCMKGKCKICNMFRVEMEEMWGEKPPTIVLM